jgi:iron complex transport system permease protein
VGFLAPHLARWFNPGAGAVRWLSWSVVWGAVVVTAADVPARLALAPVETPVGAWTALLGVPAGVALMRSGGRRRARRATVDAAAVRTAPQAVSSGSVSGAPRPEAPGHTRGSRDAGGGAAPVPGEPTGTEDAR